MTPASGTRHAAPSAATTSSGRHSELGSKGGRLGVAPGCCRGAAAKRDPCTGGGNSTDGQPFRLWNWPLGPRPCHWPDVPPGPAPAEAPDVRQDATTSPRLPTAAALARKVPAAGLLVVRRRGIWPAYRHASPVRCRPWRPPSAQSAQSLPPTAAHCRLVPSACPPVPWSRSDAAARGTGGACRAARRCVR